MAASGNGPRVENSLFFLLPTDIGELAFTDAPQVKRPHCFFSLGDVSVLARTRPCDGGNWCGIGDRRSRADEFHIGLHRGPATDNKVRKERPRCPSFARKSVPVHGGLCTATPQNITDRRHNRPAIHPSQLTHPLLTCYATHSENKHFLDGLDHRCRAYSVANIVWTEASHQFACAVQPAGDRHF